MTAYALSADDIINECVSLWGVEPIDDVLARHGIRWYPLSTGRGEDYYEYTREIAKRVQEARPGKATFVDRSNLERAQIARDYADRSIKVVTILREYRISYLPLYDILRDFRVPVRVANTKPKPECSRKGCANPVRRRGRKYCCLECSTIVRYGEVCAREGCHRRTKTLRRKYCSDRCWVIPVRACRDCGKPTHSQVHVYCGCERAAA